jgi:hypothetical protein
VRRSHEHRPLEVRLVGELVENSGELLLRRREAHVDDLEALLDRPAQPGEQHSAAAREAGAENPHADKLTLRGERADDPGACGPVTAEVSLGVLVDDDLAVRAHRSDHRLLHLADERMLRIDPAVEDADTHALAGRAAPGPLASDLSRPLDGQVEAVGCPGRKAPRRAQLML